MAGWRGAALVPLGALVIWGGPQVLRALWPEIPFGEVNLRFIPAYLVTLAGMGLVLYSFVVAYRIGNEKVAVETLIAETALPGEVATLGD